MIKYLVGPQGRFTVVGDDDQSIYAWRGAKPENMALLKEDFPKLKIVMLEQNYRSTTRILTSANAVILNNEHLFEKKLWSDKGQGEKIRIINCRNDDDESERVAKEIVTHKLRFGNEWEQYAVLYRSNFQARMLEAQLRQLQVPYKLSGGQSFFARSEIKDIMGYLRLILNPEDDSAFLRIINTPKRGMGPATLEKLGLFAQEHSISLLASCTHAGLTHVLPSKAYGTIKEFGEFIEHYTRELDQHPDPVPIVRQMIDETGYIDFVRSDAKTPQQEKNRIDNIDMLYTSIQSLINRAEEDEDRTIDTIIRKLVLLDMLEQQQEEENTNKVNLMTLHAAKGLEFDYVYIMGLEEEMLPHRNSILSETIEEERRLMYVGITRARRELTLTLATQRRAGGQMRVTSESRFLEELPEDHIDWPAKAKKKQATKDPAKVADEYLANIRALLGKR